MSNTAKTLLITGSAGFLGGEILRQALYSNKYNIIAFDRHKNRVREQFSELHPDNIYCSDDWKADNVPLTNDTIIIHCAFSRMSDGKHLAQSLDFTGELFHRAMQRDISAIVNISSQGVYGRKTKPLWYESTEPEPDYLYALAKYASEVVMRFVQNTSTAGIHGTNIRLPGLTGAKKGLKLEIVSRFVSNAINGEPIKIIGGSQVFSNMDVRDAASGILALLEVPSNKWKQVYNLGNEWQATIVEIANRVKAIAPEFVEKPVDIQIEEKEVYLNSGMNSEIFYTDTGWKPQYSLDNIIYSLFEYFQKKA